MPLLDVLTASLAAQHFAAIATLNTHTPRIAQAERLAERFQGAGIEAVASGYLRDDGSVWLLTDGKDGKLLKLIPKA